MRPTGAAGRQTSGRGGEMKIAEGFGGSAEADNEMKKRQIASRAPAAPIGASYISSLLVFTDGAKEEGAKRFTAADRKKRSSRRDCAFRG